MADEDDEAEARQIGERITAQMQQIGKEPGTLAIELDVIDDTIYKLMRGETVGRWMYLIKVARALQTSPNELLGFDGQDVRRRLECLLPAAFEGLREKPLQARNYTRIVLEALDKPPNPDKPSEESDTVRTEVAFVKRRSGDQ